MLSSPTFHNSNSVEFAHLLCRDTFELSRADYILETEVIGKVTASRNESEGFSCVLNFHQRNCLVNPLRGRIFLNVK